MNNLWDKYWISISSVCLGLITLFAIAKSFLLIRRFPERKFIKVILAFFVLTFIQLFIAVYQDYFVDPENELRGRNNITNIAGGIYLLCEYLIYLYLLHEFI